MGRPRLRELWRNSIYNKGLDQGHPPFVSSPVMLPMRSKSVPILAALAVLVAACGAPPPPESIPPPATAADTAAGGDADGQATVPGSEEEMVLVPIDRERVVPRMMVADAQQLMLEVLGAVNASRARVGARPLGIDPGLLTAARRYSNELSQRGVISHTSMAPNGRTFRQRIAAAGARARLAGENLARLTSAPETLPENVVDAWLRSPGHRRNLLDPSFTRTGIGVTLGADGIWYVTQLYASPD